MVTLEEGYKVTNRVSTRYIVFGRSLTVNEACTEYGVSLRNVGRYMGEMGMTLEQAVAQCLRTDKVFYRGNWYSSFIELCTDYHLQASVVYNRIRSGWSMLNAVETPVREQTRGKIIYCGQVYKSLTDICRDIGIQLSLAASLAHKMNYHTIEAIHILNILKQALRIPNNFTLRVIPLCVINNVVIYTHKELARHIGVYEQDVLALKTSNPNMDIISILQILQSKVTYSFSINGTPITATELKKRMGISRYNEIKDRPEYKVAFAKYPKLQGIDFNHRCIDVRYTFNKILTSYAETRSSHFGEYCDRFRLEDVFNFN